MKGFFGGNPPLVQTLYCYCLCTTVVHTSLICSIKGFVYYCSYMSCCRLFHLADPALSSYPWAIPCTSSPLRTCQCYRITQYPESPPFPSSLPIWPYRPTGASPTSTHDSLITLSILLATSRTQKRCLQSGLRKKMAGRVWSGSHQLLSSLYMDLKGEEC